MPVDVADIVFAEATDRQRQISWTVNGASWAPPMSIEAYLGREQTLSRTALSTDGGTRYYVLHLRADPDAIVSACEVTTKRGLVADAAGGVREVQTYAIASVFTPPAFRGAGMASHLLREVQKAMDAAGAECGALYSDIGRDFYTRLGWKDFRSPQLILRLEPGFVAPVRSHDDDEPPVTPLDESDVPALCAQDIAHLHAKFASLTTTGKTHFTFLPTPEQVTWHFARDTHVASVMPPADSDRRSSSRGVRTADGAAWLYWDHDLREKKLKVQRIVTTRDGDDGVHDVRALLRAAVIEARDWGLPKVLVWAPGAGTVTAATELWLESDGKLAVVLEEREDGSIPSLRWKEGKEPGEVVVWEDNEYYAWC